MHKKGKGREDARDGDVDGDARKVSGEERERTGDESSGSGVLLGFAEALRTSKAELVEVEAGPSTRETN